MEGTRKLEQTDKYQMTDLSVHTVLKTRDFISDDTTANMWSEYLLPG
jgi:hypothetical protein